jgi:hypothetical protein
VKVAEGSRVSVAIGVIDGDRVGVRVDVGVRLGVGVSVGSMMSVGAGVVGVTTTTTAVGAGASGSQAVVMTRPLIRNNLMKVKRYR